jgi:hypothetical protein
MCIVSCDVPGLHVVAKDNIAGKNQREKGRGFKNINSKLLAPLASQVLIGCHLIF